MCFVTTMWPTKSEAAVRKAADVEAEFEAKYLPSGAQTRRFHRSQQSALEIITSLPLCSPEPLPGARLVPLRIQHEMVHDRKKLNETRAGVLVGGVTQAMVKREEELEKIVRRELKELRKSGTAEDQEETAARMVAIKKTTRKGKSDINFLKKFSWKGFVRGIRSMVKFVVNLGGNGDASSRENSGPS